MSAIQDHDKVDLLVIGGGIYGCWAARHAASTGLKVLLLEQGDFASATSMASSKLIHGGLRYLEQFNFGLVKKSLLERSALHHWAPHLIQPLRFTVPIRRKSQRSSIQLKVGLQLYDWLGGGDLVFTRHEKLNPTQINQDLPWLSTESLKAAYAYSDAWTNDARLCLEVVKEAVAFGATCLNHHVVHSTRWEGHHHEVTVESSSGTSHQIKAQSVLRCTGAALRQHPQLQSCIRMTRGIHLVVSDLGGDSASLLEAVDGRVFFTIPWHGRTLIGTTDIDANDPIKDLPPSAQEIQYLLDSVNAYQKHPLTLHDIISVYSGLRVMQNDGGSPSANKRDWSLIPSGEMEWCSVGGKLTSARQDSLSMIGAILPHLHHKDHIQPSKEGLSFGRQHSLPRSYREGQEILDLEASNPAWSEPISAPLPFTWSDAVFACRCEMVVHIDDLTRRRIPLMILEPYREDLLSSLVDLCRRELHWDDQRCAEEFKRGKALWLAYSPHA